MDDGGNPQLLPLTAADADACFAIGRSLPAWFGDEARLHAMQHALATERGYVARVDARNIGFITCSQPFAETWEITWLAIASAHHRHGSGRRLVEMVATEARLHEARMLVVKTLAESHPSREYARTRAFYA